MKILSFSDMIRKTVSEQILHDFPDYDDPSLKGIELPNGFVYAGYKNDTCPSFINEKKGLKIFVDYQNPSFRENPNLERFAIYEYDPARDQYELAVSEEEWAQALFVLEHWDN